MTLFAPNTIQPKEGAYNTLWSATAKEGVTSGKYYDVVGKETKTSGTTEEAGKELWDWTEDAIKAWF